jgi:hypothetical protein
MEVGELFVLVFCSEPQLLQFSRQLLYLVFETLHLFAFPFLSLGLLQRLKTVVVRRPQALVFVLELGQLLLISFNLVLRLDHQLIGFVGAENVLNPLDFSTHLL